MLTRSVTSTTNVGFSRRRRRDVCRRAATASASTFGLSLMVVFQGSPPLLLHRLLLLPQRRGRDIEPKALARNGHEEPAEIGGDRDVGKLQATAGLLQPARDQEPAARL